MKRCTRSVAVAVLAAMVLVVGACGGSDDESADSSSDAKSAQESGGSKKSGASASADAACERVTEADATSLFGAAATKGTDSSPVASAASACIWEAEDSSGHKYLLQSRVYDGEQYYGEALFDSAERISGLGDKAFVNKGRVGVEVQYVQDGKTYSVNYSIINVGADSPKYPTEQADELIGIVKRNAG